MPTGDFLPTYIFLLVGYIVDYTMAQQRKKEESEQLRRERDQIKFIDLRCERWQAVELRKARRTQDVP